MLGESSQFLFKNQQLIDTLEIYHHLHIRQNVTFSSGISIGVQPQKPEKSYKVF
jgi:hypothetical protein